MDQWDPKATSSPYPGLLFLTHGQGTRSRSLIAPGHELPVNWRAASWGLSIEYANAKHTVRRLSASYH
jgi:hypothetical protein